MAISDSSKIDLLYKKLFGVAKTDTPTAKSPNNETIASPPLLRGDRLWANSSQIPNPTPPSSTSSYVQVYTGTARIECTADLSSNLISGVPQTWKTGLTDWIPQEFGANYAIKAYIAPTGTSDPSAPGAGIRIYQDGDSAGGDFFFDYSAGTLNFISGSMPSTFTSTLYSSSNYRVFIYGYRYVGSFGLAASGFTGTLPVANGGTGVTTATGSGSNVQATQPGFKDWISITTSASGYSTYINMQNALGNMCTLVANPTTISGANNFFLPIGAGTLIASNDLGTVSDNMLASGTTNAGLASKIVKTDSAGSITALGNFFTSTGSVTATAGTITGKILSCSQEINLSAATQGGSGTTILSVLPTVGSGVPIKIPKNAGTLSSSGDTNIFRISVPTATNTSNPLTGSALLNSIITSTTAAAVTMTLPTGTNMDTAFLTTTGYTAATNQAFDWSIINTGATNSVTVAANTAHTTVGGLTVLPSTSAQFTTIKTASNTYVTYRIS